MTYEIITAPDTAENSLQVLRLVMLDSLSVVGPH